jgi:hypothetical protein
MRSFAILQILAFGLCWGQSADESKPASSNVMGAEYPRVFADGRASFRLKAPEAQKVQVDIMAKKYDMAKGGDGFWTVTIPPQIAGFHYYRLVLLCYKRFVPQKGQQGSCRIKKPAIVRRSVAMECGLCRPQEGGAAARMEVLRLFWRG